MCTSRVMAKFSALLYESLVFAGEGVELHAVFI